MQSLNWNDLKYVLALHRAETLAAAARRLGVSDTTVSRRLAVLEHALDAPLFIRSDAGRHILTTAGEFVLARAEAVERESRALEDALGRKGAELVATVRISAVPIVINRILIPAVSSLHDQHSGITVELVPDSRNLDLTKREADLALRFSRPVAGGLRVRAAKLAEIGFAVFASAATAPSQMVPWILYDDTLGSLPQARWMAARVGKTGDAIAPIRVTDADTALEAVASGVGRTLLPVKVGKADARLQLVEQAGLSPLPRRDIWLLSHADEADRPVIVAVKAWLAKVRW